MTPRSMCAEQDEDEERGDRRQDGGAAEDPKDLLDQVVTGGAPMTAEQINATTMARRRVSGLPTHVDDDQRRRYQRSSGRLPATRQQRVDLAGALSRQALEHVLEVGVRIVAVELGRLDQARDGGGALTGGERSGEQPILAAGGPRPDLLLVVVVVDRQALLGAHARRRPCRIQRR